MQTAYDFACEWYRPDEVYRILQTNESDKIPTDIRSREFADWLCDQYRLAMTKGLELGRGSKVFL